MVDFQAVTDIDPEEVGVTEQVYYPVLAGIIEAVSYTHLLCTVDNKCTRLCHQRKISHKNLMLVNLISLFIVETDSHF